MTFIDQLQQLAFAHHGIGEVESRKFILPRREDAQLLDEPVVQRTMGNKFKRADRMRNMLDRVALTMRKIIHRVNTPGIPRPVVMRMPDPVQEGIPEMQ